MLYNGEIYAFALLGVLMGALGAAFVHATRSLVLLLSPPSSVEAGRNGARRAARLSFGGDTKGGGSSGTPRCCASIVQPTACAPTTAGASNPCCAPIPILPSSLSWAWDQGWTRPGTECRAALGSGTGVRAWPGPCKLPVSYICIHILC